MCLGDERFLGLLGCPQQISSGGTSGMWGTAGLTRTGAGEGRELGAYCAVTFYVLAESRRDSSAVDDL